jgi:pilus assembly protein CpaE
MAGILLLSVDRMLAQRIEEALGGRVPVELVQSLDAAEGPGVIVIDRAAIPPERALSAAIATVIESAAGRPVVLATDDLEAEPLLRAIRAGAKDVVPRDGPPAEIAAVLGRLLSDAVTDRGGRGRLTLVLGVDREACALAATDMALTFAGKGESSLLIDCTLPTSAAATYLDLPVDYGLASAISDMDRLDAGLFAGTAARHDPSGLMLLTFDGGTGAEPAGLSPGDLSALIKLLRGFCGDVVLNAGSLRHSGLLRDVAAQADRVDLLCGQSIREIEATRRLIDRIGAERERVEAMRLLVWDHLPGVLLDGRRMADALGVGSVMALPVDHGRLRNALNAGRPLALEGDGGAYMAAIRRACGVDAGQGGGIDRLRRAMLKVVGEWEPRRKHQVARA